MHEGKDFWDADHGYHLLLQLLVDLEKDKEKVIALRSFVGWRKFLVCKVR